MAFVSQFVRGHNPEWRHKDVAEKGTSVPHPCGTLTKACHKHFIRTSTFRWKKYLFLKKIIIYEWNYKERQSIQRDEVISSLTFI